jgi:prevent-host-death family protein
MKATEARAHWSEVLNEVHNRGARILVEKSGVAVAVIVPVSDVEQIDRVGTDEPEIVEQLFGALRSPVPALPREEERRAFEEGSAADAEPAPSRPSRS